MYLWERFLKLQEEKLGKSTVEQWLRCLKVKEYDAANLYLQAENAFQIAWFNEHIRHVAKKKFYNNNGRPIAIHLSYGKPCIEPVAPVKPARAEIFVGDTPEPDNTYSKFIVNKGNLLTAKFFDSFFSSCPVLELGTFNPLFIFGNTGFGKTHLLHACANTYTSLGKKVLFVKAQTFTQHIVTAFQEKKVHDFRQLYRACDVLVVDDVHLFGKKTATQEEFFHTFNYLHTREKQIILSSKDHPQDLKNIEERLVSRFEWGLVLPLTALSYAEKAQMVLAKSQALGCALDKATLDFLLQTFQDLHHLNQALYILNLRTSKGHIDLEKAKSVLSSLAQKAHGQVLTYDRILRIVSEFFNIQINDIVGKSRCRDCLLPRKLAMYLCRTELKMPYVKIGDVFSRDHSTVMSSIKLISDALSTQDAKVTMPLSSLQKQVANY